MLGHVHVLVNVQQRCSCAYSRSVGVICVGWHVPYAEELLLQCSLVGCSSTSLFCGSLQTGMVSQLSYQLWETTLWTSVFIYLRVGHLSSVFTISHHHLCSTEVSSASLLLSTSSVATSTNIERHSHCPQRQGYQNIHNKLHCFGGNWG